ncbi:MAG: alpha/beta fold hydrolase [Bacteroidales bacterium]|nr:alpha/beta fold hydrolase [Clostridia bacterium]MBQ8469151.1 alpha/beta fold hydrolase [Clostridia bacterium]MBR1699561.1 alpha/beta fold hydrolase [Bacteroidales bacterium]
MSTKDKLIADVVARGVAAFTTKNFQNAPRPMVAAVKKTPVLADFVRNRYDVDVHTVPSFDGLKLNVTRFRAVKGCHWDGKNHVILLVHGFQVQQAAMWFDLPFFLPHGYDCVTVDLRTAGLSEGKGINTMGANEAKDVAEVCKWIRQEYGDDVVLGLYGQSMGSATIMQYSSKDPNLGFIIEDCGYASLEGTIKNIHDRFLGFVDWDEFWPKVLKYASVGDVSYKDVEPIESIRKLDPEVPMMILHSIPDAYIVVENADLIYDAKRGKKEIHKYTLAPHSTSFFFHPLQYKKDIDAFFEKYGLLKK